MPNPTDAELTAALGAPVARRELLGGGGNSRLSKLELADGRRVVVKQYLADRPDRDPLGCEFESLQFLWTQGIRRVPRPLVSLPAQRCAIYEFVAGVCLAELPVTSADLDQFCPFIESLQPLRDAAAAAGLPLASEACFSPSEVYAAIERRWGKLRRVDDADLQAYLSRLGRLRDGIRPDLGAAVSPAAAHPRILSPSDFGIHNALRGGEGAITFVDFEYFGWDHPAKLISDFWWHPANDPLADATKNRLASQMLAALDEDARLAEHVRGFFPLCGLNWCLILLNEFLPLELSRRQQARVTGYEDTALLRKRQLEKSSARLKRLELAPHDCPFV